MLSNLSKKHELALVFTTLVFSFCVSMPLKSNESNRIGIKADSPYTTIGYMYDVDPKVSTGKVYIPYSRISFIESLGLTVYSELSGGGGLGPISPMGIPDNTDGIIEPPTLLYYYYCSPVNPVVVGNSPREMKNDYESLVFAVNLVEKAAKAYYHDDLDYISNATLGYIRAVNSKYVDDYFELVHIWSLVCGDLDEDFIEYINSLNNYGQMRICEYFASFVSSSDLNNNYSYFCQSTYKNNNFLLVDPFNYQGIDLIHMFASFDGIALNTDSSVVGSVYGLFVSEQTFRHLVSWGGDLQTVAKQIDDMANPPTLSSFEDILSMSNSLFPLSDLLADMDAYIMATNLDLKSSTNTYDCISSLINSYYSGREQSSTDTRKENFVSTLASTISEYNTTENKVIFIVNRMLKMNFNGTNNSTHDYSDCIRYRLLGVGVDFLSVDYTNLCSYPIRSLVGQLFINYLTGNNNV